METFYTYCAVIGGILLVGQFCLSLLGIGDHDLHDIPTGGMDFHADAGADHFDHGGTWFTGMLSFRAIVSATTIFGLAGLGAQRHFDAGRTFIIAGASGGAMMYGVAWMLRVMYRLKSDGTALIERAVGQTGSVYLTVPANRAGEGKVTVDVQGRTMEYTAVSSGSELATGTPVVVVGVVNPGTVELAQIAESAAPESATVTGETHV